MHCTRYQKSVYRILPGDNLSTICTLHNFLLKILIFENPTLKSSLSLIEARPDPLRHPKMAWLMLKAFFTALNMDPISTKSLSQGANLSIRNALRAKDWMEKQEKANIDKLPGLYHTFANSLHTACRTQDLKQEPRLIHS